MTPIATQNAPAAIGPYSQAIAHGGMVWCSGQVALDPAGGGMIGDDAATQAVQCLRNLSAVLAAAGSSLQHAVKVTIFLADMNDFAEVNAVYSDAMGEHRPARACVEVARLPKDALVEIDCVAVAG